MRRPLQVELDERVAAVTEMLAHGLTDGEIKKAAAAKFKLSPRSIERYARRARAGMVQATGKDIETLRKEAIDVYAAIVNDPKAENRDRIKARERIDRLLGLEIHVHPPRKVELTGANGGPIQAQASVIGIDLGARLAEFMPAIRAALAANGASPALPAPNVPDAT